LKEKYLPSVEVRPLQELLVYLNTVNGHLPFNGWAVFTVNLLGNEDPCLSINAPFLESKMSIEKPLLGFNLVEEEELAYLYILNI